MSSIPLEELEAQAPFLRRLARALVRDEHAAGDLVQETWVAALRHGPREGEEARGWLARLLRGRARSARRGEARRVARERAAGGARAGGGAGGGPAVAERVLAAVLALEEPYRGTILRRYYEDLSPRAIAERTGTPLKTVEARLARARAELRRRLDGDFGGRAAWGVALGALAGLERPARLASAALLLAAAGVCGAGLVGWQLWHGPAATEGETARLEAPPLPAPAPPAELAPPRAVEPVREPAPSAPPASARPASAPLPDLGGSVEEVPSDVAVVMGRVQGADLIAPWVALVPERVSADGVKPLAEGMCDPNGAFRLEVSFASEPSAQEDPASADMKRFERQRQMELAGRSYLVAVAEGCLASVQKLRLGPGRALEVHPVLVEGGVRAAGYTVERSGALIGGARVFLRRDKVWKTVHVGPYELELGGRFYLAAVEVTSEPGGSFDILGLAPGSHRAVVVPPAADGLEALVLPWRENGQRVLPPDATLELTPSLDELVIHALGPAGPVPGLMAFYVRRDELRCEPEQLMSTLETGALQPLLEQGVGYAPVPDDGQLRIAFEPRDDYLLFLRRVGFKTACIETAKARPTIHGRLVVMLLPTFELPALELVIEVAAATGWSIPGVPPADAPRSVEVVLAPEARLPWVAPLRRVLPFAPTLLVHDVPPGRYEVWVNPVGASPFVPAHAAVSVAEDKERTKLALALARGGIVRVVARADVEALAGLELVLERGAGERLVCTPSERGKLAAGETAELTPRVPPGLWRARLVLSGRQLSETELRIQPGAAIDLPLAPGDG